MKKKKLKCYDVSLDSDVYAISLVEEPAIEADFLFLSKQKELYLEDEYKHQIVGAVLIPNQKIYRVDENGEEYYIQFSAQTIEKLAHKYLENGRIFSTTQDHDAIADDVYVIESFILDSDNYMGMKLSKGTWMVKMQCDNDEVWNRIKNGELNGYSIESFVNLDEIKLSKNQNINMEINDSFWSKLKEIIKEVVTPEVEEPVAVAEEIVETVKEEVEEPVQEEMEEETEPVVETVEEIVEEVVETVVAESESAEEAEENLQVVIDELQAKVDELTVENEELKKKCQKLSKQPSVAPVSQNNKQNVIDVIRQLRGE